MTMMWSKLRKCCSNDDFKKFFVLSKLVVFFNCMGCAMAQIANNNNEEWPPSSAEALEAMNKGKVCPLTPSEENVATFAMG